MQNYWTKNKERLSLSDSFMDFSFWELPRLKHPLFLIPIVIIIAVSIQVVAESGWLLFIFLLILGLLIYFVITTVRYHLSPEREYETLVERWNSDTEWKERWFKRIKVKLDDYGNVTVSDLYEFGLRNNARNNIEIIVALNNYFATYEFDEDLILLRTSALPIEHPERTVFKEDTQWILLRRKNYYLRENKNP